MGAWPEQGEGQARCTGRAFCRGQADPSSSERGPSADQIGEWWAEYAALSSDGDVASDTQAIVNGIPAAPEEANIRQANRADYEIVDENFRNAAEVHHNQTLRESVVGHLPAAFPCPL
ncbi:hypothetical protein [Rhizobium sp. PL01]|uniref:hypothetical protein n=1 Tax=Rhizobium sp. PL01 TaxID=3085631 RepID=UPI00298124CF|nr:hypothetical protein [Rhizobium sp. PL01]MDW5315914.1 hypothetical protein [Rhizobium sp. PL01]